MSIVAGVAAVTAALLSATNAALFLLENFHLPARARITLTRSLAVLPATVVAPFTAASAAIKYSSENLAILKGRVRGAFGWPSPPALSVRYSPIFQRLGNISLLIPLGATTKSALPGICPAPTPLELFPGKEPPVG